MLEPARLCNQRDSLKTNDLHSGLNRDTRAAARVMDSLNPLGTNQIAPCLRTRLFWHDLRSSLPCLTDLNVTKTVLIQRPDIRLSNVLAGLSYALDLTEGQREGHAIRSCLIGMRIARELQLPSEQQSALFYALLMKDLGCSSNAARFAVLFGADDQRVKADLKTTD